MPAADFPPELWTEIVSYLPKNTLRKMIGVNRLLFELALNDLYEEVHFTSDDKRTANIFEQLLKPHISARTKRLLIRPTFLPSAEGRKNSMSDKLLFRVSSCLSNITNNFPLDKASFRNDQDIFTRARKAARRCTSLEEVTIVLHDQSLTSPFLAFLDSLWSSDSINHSLRKLRIDTTVYKIPVVIASLLKHSAKYPSVLKEVDITLSNSRIVEDSEDWSAAKGMLVNFLHAFKNTLTSFKFSSLLDREIDGLFASFPHLQNLRAFEFRSVFNAAVVSDAEAFTRFISMHTSTLHHLVIKPYPRSTTLHKSDISYTSWLSPNATTEYKSIASFSSLVLPNLRTLDLGLGEYWNEFGTGRQYLLPDFPRITPNLTSLVLTDTKLSTESVITFLDILSRCEEVSLLENLAFSCYVIFPELFFLLYSTVPRLKSLSIQHISYLPMLGNVARYKGRIDVVFAEKLRSRTYPQWHLQYVRLASPPSSCGATHPNIALMEALSRALCKDIILDSCVECQCTI